MKQLEFKGKPTDGQLVQYDAETRKWYPVDPGDVIDAPSGASAPEFHVRAYLGGGAPFVGGSGYTALYDGDTENSALVFTTPPFVFAADHQFEILIVAPTFSAGTLSVVYAEMDVCSPDGAQAKGVGTTNIPITSGVNLDPLTLNDGDEFPQVGADLSQVGQTIKTTAGGVFVVSFFAKFAASVLVA